MANSVFIPLYRMPTDIDELRKIITSTFIELRFPSPSIRLEIHNVPCEDGLLSDGFIVVEGRGEDETCWATVGKVPVELTEDPAANFLADVTTRGSWTFAGIVAYAFCKSYGKVVFNDSGELGEQECYNIESLRDRLVQAIGKIDT